MSRTLSMTHHNTQVFTATVSAPAGETLDVSKAWFSAKALPTDVAALIAKTESAGIAIAGNGTATIVLTITLDPTDTNSLAYTEQRLAYDIQILTSGGDVYTVDDGMLVVTPTATRDIT